MWARQRGGQARQRGKSSPGCVCAEVQIGGYVRAARSIIIEVPINETSAIAASVQAVAAVVVATYTWPTRLLA